MSSDSIVSHGRGGAGNIAPDENTYADGEIVREGPLGDQGDGAYSSGVSSTPLSQNNPKRTMNTHFFRSYSAAALATSNPPASAPKMARIWLATQTWCRKLR